MVQQLMELINGTNTIKTIGGSFIVINSVANPVQKFLVDANGNLTASGDLKYNGSTSLTSQMATLNGYETSGTFSGTTSWQTIFSFLNVRGFIVITSGSPSNSMITAMFEHTYNLTYPSLTLIASSGNNNQLALNTSSTSSGGTQNVFIQLSNTNIQVKVSSPATCNWSVSFL